MTGSHSIGAPIVSALTRASVPHAKSQADAARLAPVSLSSEPIVHSVQGQAGVGDAAQALRGAVPLKAPDIRLKPFGWAHGLAAGGDGQVASLLRKARAGTLPKPQLGADCLRNLPLLRNRAPKRDWHFLGMTIRRDQRYKSMLSQADTLKQLYEQPPAANPEELRQQVQDLAQALTSFQNAIARYAARASLVRRTVLHELANRTSFERIFVGKLAERLADPQQPVVAGGPVDSLGGLLDYARAGVDVSLAGAALEAGIGAQQAGPAALLAGDTLSLAALSLLRYPELAQFDRAIETLAFLLGLKAYTVQQIDDGLALGLSPKDLARRADEPGFKADLASKRAYLQAFVEAGNPDESLIEQPANLRRAAAALAQRYSDENVPADFARLCADAGFKADDARQLMQGGALPQEVAQAGEARITATQLLQLKADQVPVDEVAYQLKRGLDFTDARQSVLQLPDDASLGWLRQPSISGKRLLRAEAALLLQAGIQPGLALADVMNLLGAGVSPSAVSRLSQSPPDEALVGAFLALDMSGSKPFSRAEALLLAHAGWPANDDTVELFRCAYENNTLIVPINEHTVRRELARGQPMGEPKKLGAGAFNTVYAVKFQDPATQQLREGVFKPLQTADDEHWSVAAMQIGIPVRAPRYELRNLAHARLDQALGFQSVPACELAVVDGQPGLLMQRVEGTTARISKMWRPPVDITATPLGRELAQFVGTSMFDDYARRKGVDVQVRSNAGRHQILLREGDYIPPLKPAEGEWQRSLIGLQWLHAISGAADSHDKNIMRSVDGQRFVGIDNDVSFGGGLATNRSQVDHPDGMMKRAGADHTRAFRGQGLPPIADQSQFDAMMTLSPARLTEELGPLLRPAELKATLKRLEVVQEHLRALQTKGCIIAPTRWGQHSFNIVNKAPESSYIRRQYKARRNLPIDAT